MNKSPFNALPKRVLEGLPKILCLALVLSTACHKPQPKLEPETPKGTYSQAFLSADQKRSARIFTGENKKSFVESDGKKEKEYDEILSLPQFSPDGQKLFYVAKLNGKKRVVVNGLEDPEYDDLVILENEERVLQDGSIALNVPIYFRFYGKDGQNFYYRARQKNQEVLVLNGVPGSPFTRIEGLTLSAEGNQVVYIGLENESFFESENKCKKFPDECAQAKCKVMIDNKEVRECPGGTKALFVRGFVLSPDLQKVAGALRRGSMEYLLNQGEEEEEGYPYIREIQFSPNGDKVAYIGDSQGVSTVVVENGKKIGDYCDVNKLKYQPDGTLAIDGKKKEGDSCAPAASHTRSEKLSKLSCKPKALAAIEKIPSFDYKCELGYADFGDENLTNPVRLKAIHLYEKKLAAQAGPDWWAIPTKELNACEVHPRVGRLTEEEVHDLGSGSNTQGDSQLRLITTGDPCLATGNASPSNAFLLVNQNGKTVVTQVVDGFYSRFDEATSFSTAQRGNELFAVTNSIGHDATFLYSSDLFYQIDPSTGKALTAKIFVNNYGTLSHRLNTSAPMFVGPHKEIIDTPVVKGNLVDKFYRYSYCTIGNDDPDCPPKGKKAFRIKDENSEEGFFATIDRTLTWNGKTYVDDRQDQLKKDYEEKVKELRACIQSKFDPKGRPVPCNTSGELACEANNDLAWLNFKAGNLKDAERFASDAINDCEEHPPKEQQAARYNQEQIQKALKTK